MSLPYPSTVARDKVIANARHLESTGITRGAAYAEAFNKARETWFKRNPDGALPQWLSQQGKRARRDYTETGALLRDNPMPRQVNAAERLYADFAGDAPVEHVTVNVRGVNFKVGIIVGAVLKLELDIGLYTFAPNDGGGLPALVVSHDGRQCAFIGGDYEPLISEGLDNPKITGIMYRTVRDGKVEHYRHPFAKFAQPALKVIDARNAKMIGGSFRFTERGFVDTRHR